MSRRAAATGLVAAAIVAIVLVAAVDAVRSLGGAGDEPSRASRPNPASDRLGGPFAPPPGALPGTLVLAYGRECAIRTLDLSRAELGPAGPATGCRIWASPRGDFAVVTRSGTSPGTAPDLELVRLEGTPRVVARLGRATSAPSVSPDGARVAWCRGDTTFVLDFDGMRERAPGCFPAYAPDGSLVTRTFERGRTAVLRDGKVILGHDEIGQAINADGPRSFRVLGHGVVEGGRLVLALVVNRYGFQEETYLGIWDGRALVELHAIPSYGVAGRFFGLRVEPGPSGAEAAITSPASLAAPRTDDLVSVVDLQAGVIAEALAGERFGGLAWSRDGVWLALATGSEVRVYGPGRAGPAYVLPVAVSGIGWSA